MTQRRPRRKPRPPAGGRPKTIGDFVERIVARRVGRDLTPMEGAMVQVVALAIFVALVYLVFASGVPSSIAGQLATSGASPLPLAASPSPTP